MGKLQVGSKNIKLGVTQNRYRHYGGNYQFLLTCNLSYSHITQHKKIAENGAKGMDFRIFTIMIL